MESKEFIEKFAEAIEIDELENLTLSTEFKDLEEWSSISIMLLIAFFDQEFDKQIGDTEVRQAKTIEDLYKIAIS